MLSRRHLQLAAAIIEAAEATLTTRPSSQWPRRLLDDVVTPPQPLQTATNSRLPPL